MSEGYFGALESEAKRLSERERIEERWYTKEEMYHWLKCRNYSDSIANELSQWMADNLQLAYEKGKSHAPPARDWKPVVEEKVLVEATLTHDKWHRDTVLIAVGDYMNIKVPLSSIRPRGV